MFERAVHEKDPEVRRALLTFVIVGGGPTGVECAGAFSELIRLVLIKDYPGINIKDVRIILLEAERQAARHASGEDCARPPQRPFGTSMSRSASARTWPISTGSA